MINDKKSQLYILVQSHQNWLHDIINNHNNYKPRLFMSQQWIFLPLITVVQRTGCGAAAHEAGMSLLDLVIEGERRRAITI
jgi:hypothetical protein